MSVSGFNNPTKIIGRFAPSPTGPLHQGSLVAAVGSYLLAKQTGGDWLLRIEDLDPPREVSGAAQQIIDTLAEFGLYWDGEITWQSQRTRAYQKVFERLQQDGCIYPCRCSRKQILERNDGVYDGYCRNQSITLPNSQQMSEANFEGVTEIGWRYIFDDAPLPFKDSILGQQQLTEATDCQDFIIKRRDGFFAYQLAVVVDDHFSGVNQVVRGADILDSTPRQISLFRRLGWRVPDYYHLPLVVDEKGHKLSKSQLAPGISAAEKSQALFVALEHLGQQPPANLISSDCESILLWALENFCLDKVPGQVNRSST